MACSGTALALVKHLGIQDRINLSVVLIMIYYRIKELEGKPNEIFTK
jgi:hypothetical protein